MDLTLKFRFVDRGGLYVFDVTRTATGQQMKAIRIPAGLLAALPKADDEAPEVGRTIDPAQLELPLNIPQ
jgi:hypothetical protein